MSDKNSHGIVFFCQTFLGFTLAQSAAFSSHLSPDSPIGYVRRRVQATLSRLATSTVAVQESFLLKENHFCGIRFSLGSFVAVWKTEVQEFTIYCDQELIERVSIAPQAINRAA